MPKDTRESILAAGHVTIIRPPAAIGKGAYGAFPTTIRLTRSQIYSDAPPPFLRPVKPPSEMTSKELDRELGKQVA